MDTFLKRIRLVCADCKYNNKDEHIHDTLIYRLNSRHVQSKLLELTETSTLADAMKMAQQYEANSKQLDDIHGRQSVIHALYSNQRNKPKNCQPHQKKTHAPLLSAPPSACNNCGRAHSRAERCPAHRTTCKACGKSNHWAKMCRSSQRSHGARKAHSTRVHALYEADAAASQEDADAIYFLTLQHTAKKTSDVTRGNDSGTQAIVTLNAALRSQASDIKFKIDTGSEGSVIPLSVYRSLLSENARDVNRIPPGLRPSTTRLIAFGGHSIQKLALVI